MCLQYKVCLEQRCCYVVHIAVCTRTSAGCFNPDTSVCGICHLFKAKSASCSLNYHALKRASDDKRNERVVIKLALSI